MSLLLLFFKFHFPDFLVSLFCFAEFVPIWKISFFYPVQVVGDILQFSTWNNKEDYNVSNLLHWQKSKVHLQLYNFASCYMPIYTGIWSRIPYKETKNVKYNNYTETTSFRIDRKYNAFNYKWMGQSEIYYGIVVRPKHNTY